MSWNCFELVKDCSIAHKTKYKIIIPYEIDLKLKLLVSEINTEWIAYLSYDRSEDDKSVTFTVKDIVIPKQEVSVAHAEVLEPVTGNYGIIHSHQFSDSKFFSHTDDSSANSNNPFSLVINSKGEYLATVRVKLPCDSYTLVEAKVSISFKDDQAFLSEVRSKISERKIVYKYINAKCVYSNYCQHSDDECETCQNMIYGSVGELYDQG